MTVCVTSRAVRERHAAGCSTPLHDRRTKRENQPALRKRSRFGIKEGVRGRCFRPDHHHARPHCRNALLYLFEVRDNGKPLRVAYLGGTAIPFNATGAYYDGYIASSNKLAKAAAE